MNDCEKYEALCSAMLDNALTVQEKEELDAHLAMCPSCRAYLEDLREMSALWKELEIPVPEDLHEKMMGAIEAEVQKTIVQTPQKELRRPPVFTMLAAAAACVMLAVSGQLTGLFGQMSAVPLQNAAQRNTPATAEVTPPPAVHKPVQAEAPPKQQEPTIKPQPEPTEPQKPAEEPPEPPAAEQSVPEEPVVQEDVPQVISEEPTEDTVAVQQASSGKMVRGAAEQPAVATYTASGLPEELRQMQFARCYDVTGGTELPVLDAMTLLVAADGVSYYSVENNESKIGQVQEELKKSGYTLTLNETSGISIQRSAKAILLIVYMA